jgi:hypothetical protein
VKKYLTAFIFSLLLLCLFAGTAYLCGGPTSFRAYLDKTFWMPFARYEDSILKPEAQKQKKGVTTGKDSGHIAFAGFSTAPASEALSRVRKAYIAAMYDRARTELTAAEKAGLVGREKEELRLLDAKLDMRVAEGKTPVDRELLLKARSKLEAFLGNAQFSFWKSEARGWLARVYYLLDEHSAAVKMYLDEMSLAETVFDRKSLSESLQMIFPYNGSDTRLADHLEDYFDTPAHALFIVYLVTNPVYSQKERAATAKVAQKVITALEKHEELFNGNNLSDSLALALMRASVFMGDTRRALAYSRKIPATSKMAKTPDYNWMLASCYFLQRDYARAEAPLLKIVRSKEATKHELSVASQGLIGVYQKLGRKVDQLHAAFTYEQIEEDELEFSRFTACLPVYGWLLDLPYLLDIHLSDNDLKEYLVRYEKQARQMRGNTYPRNRTVFETIEYALAVRLARQEKYTESAEIYEKINARPRADRMRVLAGLYIRATDNTLSAEEQLNAQYQYASFLEGHSTGIFFNDMLWHGIQTSVFLDKERNGLQGLTKNERDQFLKQERKTRDEQEERWRAYHILANVVDKTGHTELGKTAAIKAIRCLDLINTDRFDRADEIDQARKKLLNWLQEHRKKTG